jgi:hypothetical protein
MLISRSRKVFLRLSVLMAMLFLLFSFQSQPSAKAFSFSGCDENCFQRCYDNYFDCVSTNSYEGCCYYNTCSHFCGDDCPLFCAE